MKFAAVKVNVVSFVPLSAIAASVGASFTAVTVMVKVWAALVATPPIAVPPVSWAVIVTVAVPLAFAAGVKVSVPLALIAGWALKRALLLLVIVRLTVCADSSVGPADRLVAKPLWVCAPASSATVTT